MSVKLKGWAQLRSPALVIPQTKSWRVNGGQILGLGSVVEVLESSNDDPGSISPITEEPNEIYVAWIDVAGRVTKGWLAANTPLSPLLKKSATPTRVSRDLGPLSAWDLLRSTLAKKSFSLLKWCARVRKSEVPWARSIVRELGGRLNANDDASIIVRKLLRLTINREVSMKTLSAAKSTTKAKGSTPNAKSSKEREVKVHVSAEPSARSASRTIGVTVLPLLQKAKVKEGVSVAKRLAEGGTATIKELQGLRDAINVAADKARESENTKLASQLSSANRLVRRQYRAQRAAK